MARPVLKRDAIEQAVLQLIAQNGLGATTIQHVARQADVSPGLLYRYWKNLDQLAAEIYRTEHARLLERLKAAQVGVVGFWPTLEALVRAFLDMVDDQPAVIRFLLLSQHELARSIAPERGVFALLRLVMETGWAAGELREMDHELGVQMLLGIGMQPVIGTLYGSLPGPVARFADEINGAIRRALGRTDEPAEPAD